MDLTPYLQSIIDQDPMPVVICALDHTILYANPAAENRQAQRDRPPLTGANLADCHMPQSMEKLERVLDWFRQDRTHNNLFMYKKPELNRDLYAVALRDKDGELIGYYQRQIPRDPETAPGYDFRP